MVFSYFEKVKANGFFDARRNGQAKYWMYETVNEQLHNRFYHARGMEELLAHYEKELLAGRVTSFAAAAGLLGFYDKTERENNG